MEFTFSERCEDLKGRLLPFMDEFVYPAEEIHERQMAESGDPQFHPPIVEELKAAASASERLSTCPKVIKVS